MSYEEVPSNGGDGGGDKINKKGHSAGLVRRTIMNIPRFSFKREKVRTMRNPPPPSPSHPSNPKTTTMTTGLDQKRPLDSLRQHRVERSAEEGGSDSVAGVRQEARCQSCCAAGAGERAVHEVGAMTHKYERRAMRVVKATSIEGAIFAPCACTLYTYSFAAYTAFASF